MAAERLSIVRPVVRRHKHGQSRNFFSSGRILNPTTEFGAPKLRHYDLSGCPERAREVGAVAIESRMSRNDKQLRCESYSPQWRESGGGGDGVKSPRCWRAARCS